MRKNYIIDDKKKIIVAKVGNLTEKQAKTIKNYLTLGYKLQEYVKPNNEKFTKEKVLNYLKAKGTEEQIKKFNDLQNEPLESGELKKDGTPRTKGYIAGLRYFKTQFPEY